MSAFWRFVILIGLLHIALGWCLSIILEDQPGLFIAAELGLLFTLLFSFGVYNSFRKPLKLIRSGIDALADQDFTVKFTPTPSTEMNQLITTYNQMIDKIREERVSIAEQHYFLEQLIQASPNGLILLDYDGKVATINESAIRISQQFGYQPQNSDDFVQESLKKNDNADGFIISPNGFQKYKVQRGTFLHRGFTRTFFSIQDLSKDLLETEKKAYGKVIRMMAHEVNNSIGAINSILQTTFDTLQEENTEKLQHADLIEGLAIAIDRNRMLNRFMRNFADVIKLPPPDLESYSLHKLLNRVTGLMQYKAKTQNVNINLKLTGRDIYEKMDPKQIEQALINIIKNAIEAISAQGTIEIRLFEHPTRIEIADNGEGIDPKIANQLFTPFQSTKATGQGIGLTLVKEILINHDIKFSLQTRQTGWTVFELIFPTF